MKTSTLIILVITLIFISLALMAESEVTNEKRDHGGDHNDMHGSSGSTSLYSLNIAHMGGIMGGIFVTFGVLFNL
ncbi:hypothetical protein F8M41_026231 [Gigaspora margarita]|uniref:Transmembrane protein n=1 Tax=Gigaspora margarita TaxID=4874 RepID=A0A8H4AAF8_GIGMA|nr:hypothetical protein F8M41_026231 [Gigaspora margarita]